MTASAGNGSIACHISHSVLRVIVVPGTRVAPSATTSRSMAGHARATARARHGGTMRLWGGRFSEENDARVAEFTRSIEIDASWRPTTSAGSIAHVRGLGRAGLLTGDEVDELVDRAARRSPRTWPPTASCGTRARGRPPEPRVGAGRARRTGRGQAPHRPVAQRPGRHGPPALDASGHRPPRRRHRRVRAGARRSGRARRAGRPAGHDPHPAGPARALRATTCSRTSRWPSATAAASPMPGAG